MELFLTKDADVYTNLDKKIKDHGSQSIISVQLSPHESNIFLNEMHLHSNDIKIVVNKGLFTKNDYFYKGVEVVLDRTLYG